jgi:hypothetical protein
MYEAVKARPIYIVEQVYQQQDGRVTGHHPAESGPRAT